MSRELGKRTMRSQVIGFEKGVISRPSPRTIHKTALDLDQIPSDPDECSYN